MNFKHYSLLLALVFFIVLTMGIGYATVNNTSLSINGTGGSASNGVVEIRSATLTDSENVTATAPVIDGANVSFNISFTVDENSSNADNYTATYRVEIFNDSINSYTFGSELFSPTLDITTPDGNDLNYNYTISGVQPGDVITAKTSVTFDIILQLYPTTQGNYSVGVETEVGASENNDGIIAGSLNDPKTGDLSSSNTLAHFSINVMNSYQAAKEFTLSTNNNNFEIVDQNGNAISTPFSINGETDSQTYDFYIKVKSGARFPNDTQRFNIILNPTDGNPITTGTLTITVDVDPTLNDTTAPTISSFKATKGNTTKTIQLSWEANDNIGIDHYNLYMYDSTNNVVNQALDITTTSHTFSDLSDGTYSFKLEAYDGSNNSSSSTISSKEYTWTYTITITCSNCTANPASGATVQAGGTFTTTLSANNNYNDPTIQSVYMYDSSTETESQVSSGSYTYNNQTFRLTNITGNVRISAQSTQGTCLVEGTKILLYNGKTKNIEDINYDDLMAVWSHDTGKLTYEYPLWIENEHKTNKYINITFSDDSELNIVNNHALYDVEHKKYINLKDNEFKIGAKIAKITNDGKFDVVTIKNIKSVQKNIKYYFVGSTTYFNIIANNTLTTDNNTMISNFYGFDEYAMWPKSKHEIVKNNKNIVPYSEFIDILPYYLYKGFRAGEVGYLINNNIIDLKTFRNYITTFITNKYFIKEPITKNNIRYWMVTTSNDDMKDKSKHLLPEGSYYKLPKNSDKNFIGWFNTADNKLYQPNALIKVYHGIHFEALYEK